MLAINLTPWAGDEKGRPFNYTADQLIDLPDDTARLRIAAGVMREPTEAELAGKAQLHPGWPGTPKPESQQQGGDGDTAGDTTAGKSAKTKGRAA